MFTSAIVKWGEKRIFPRPGEGWRGWRVGAGGGGGRESGEGNKAGFQGSSNESWGGVNPDEGRWQIVSLKGKRSRGDNLEIGRFPFTDLAAFG